jgi:hypothetical protein
MNWWWRDVIKRLPKRPAYKQARWHEIDEVPAFRWELVRRLFPLDQYPAYTELSRWEIEYVRQILGHGTKPVVMDCMDSTPPLPGYPIFARTGWNLRAGDEAPKREFMARIEAERKRAGIARPPRNRGNYHRGVAWGQVELMETGTGLNDAQRSHLAQAREKARGLQDKFLQAWSEIQQSRARFAKQPELLAQPNEPMNWQEWL